ncbi:hypothetical protein [Bradyrhizobium elkanii]|uniref:hypothetical protein n=1 Tax=Bradyrhizobium elkanii TaxID=29448 RepID=UPI0035171648
MSSTDRKTFEIALDRIGRGDATPAEAATVIRTALAAEPSLVERVYDALRDVTWRTLTSRSFGDELPNWYDVIRHAAAVAGSKAGSDVAAKMLAFADLISQSARFAELQPLEEVLNRKHTKSLLAALAGAGKSITNIALMSILGLRESNLSRVTGALQGTGLIERTSSGKEASFTLTDRGRQAAAKLNIDIKDPGTEREWWNEAPFPVAVWEADGKVVGANPAFYRLTRAQEPHALVAFEKWKMSLAKAALEHGMASADTWRLQIDDATWIQFVETVMPDGRLCLLGSDVSVTMKAISQVKAALKVAQEAEARARREFADMENRLIAYQSANSHIRDEIMTVAARSNERVRDVLQSWTASVEHLVPTELLAVEKDLGAMQVAVRDLMVPVQFVTQHGKPVSGWLDPRQIVAEAMSTARDLNPSTQATVSFGNVPRVRGLVDTMRAVLNHAVILGTRHGAYDFHGTLKGSNLVTTVRVKTPDVNPYPDPFQAVVTSGMGYCRAIVETNGGAFEETVSGSDAMFVFSLPVEEANARKGPVRFGVSGKAKPRKPTSGSHR